MFPVTRIMISQVALPTLLTAICATLMLGTAAQHPASSVQQPTASTSAGQSATDSLLRQADDLDKQANEAAAKAQELEQKAKRAGPGLGAILGMKYSIQARQLRDKERQYRQQAQTLRAQAAARQSPQRSDQVGTISATESPDNGAGRTGGNTSAPSSGSQILDHEWCSLSYPQDWKAYLSLTAVVLSPEPQPEDFSRRNSRPPHYGAFISAAHLGGLGYLNEFTASDFQGLLSFLKLNELQSSGRQQWGRQLSYSTHMTINGRPAEAAEIARSSNQGDQRAWIVAILPPGHGIGHGDWFIFFIAFLAPEQDFKAQLPLFQKIVSTIVVKDIGLPKCGPGMSPGRYDCYEASSKASGSLVPIPLPTPPPLTGNSSCNQLLDLGYSILLQGHLYKVKGLGAPGPNQLHLFLDEKNAQVTDSHLLSQLASAAWTRENVVVSPDARNGAGRVSAIFGTSKALQRYSAVQDALARAMAEAIEAGLTGEASLTKAVPNITIGILQNQLKSAPQTLFILAAQHGLEMSADAYSRMNAVPLPPADATALIAADLTRIKKLYIQARSLELPYEALAAKLMPTSGSQLTNQAFASAVSELIPSTGLKATDMVTLQNLFDLQKSVANLSGTLPALQAYSENLRLAINLATAENRTISKSATESASACGTTP